MMHAKKVVTTQLRRTIPIDNDFANEDETEINKSNTKIRKYPLSKFINRCERVKFVQLKINRALAGVARIEIAQITLMD